MDEGFLNDLLECSVCLERLDTSSKVLPCQHTFCKKCLEEIVHKHKELRCPECRILVTIKVEELPPNVLLMRILEGMRNAVPKKSQRSNRSSPNHNPPVVLHAVPIQHGTPEHRVQTIKQTSPHLLHHQPYAKALYDYLSKESGDLSFKKGDIIILRKRVDNNWYQGECAGKQGVFPISYVQIITPQPSHFPQCKALYDFRMTNDEDEGCLVFSKGDIINVIRRVDENWAEGKLDGKIGIFPLAFVELNNLARSLMKLSSNAQPGPSRLAPPTPTTEDSTPLIPTDHTRNVVAHHHTGQNAVAATAQSHAPQPLVNSDSSSTVSSGGSSTTPNISSSNTSSSSSTAPSSPASPPPRAQPLPPKTVPKPDVLPNTGSKSGTPQRSPRPDGQSSHHNKEKRHSFTGLSQSTHHHSSGSSHRHSVEIVGDGTTAHSTGSGSERSRRSGQSTSSSSNNGTEVQLPVAYIALYPYKPQKADELELRKGGIYMVTERCQDGWFKGTSNRTQKCGVFPGNYVIPARGTPSGAQSSTSTDPASKNAPVSYPRGRGTLAMRLMPGNPPELPPRATSPHRHHHHPQQAAAISNSWHGQQEGSSSPSAGAVPIGRSSSTVMSGACTQHLTTPKAADKQSKDRKEKGTVSLMWRLASMKRSKSPPASSYSMDNPVFEDITIGNTASPSHPVHVRSGSCPSQLLQIQPSADHHRLFGTSSQRHKHKERPSVLTHSNPRTENPAGSSGSSPDIHRHRKSNSLDAGSRSSSAPKSGSGGGGTQTVRERFRCIAPYPPNSEYELELYVNDIIYVHKKRDDGWYKGTQQRTGRTGLFPASFVESW